MVRSKALRQTRFPSLLYGGGSRYHSVVGEENLREVVLFPMNQRAEDLMMGAPSDVSPKQLRELHIRVVKPTST